MLFAIKRAPRFFLGLFKGRMNRFNFLKNWLLLMAAFLMVVFSLGENLPDESYYGTFNTVEFSFLIAFFLFAIQLLYIFWFCLMLSILVRRWHDIGYGGWLLLVVIPISFIPLVFLFPLFLRGDERTNEYGDMDLSPWSLKGLFSLK